MITDQPIALSPEREREIDELIVRLEYLKRVRLARVDAQKQLAAAGAEYSPAQVERLLNGGARP